MEEPIVVPGSDESVPAGTTLNQDGVPQGTPEPQNQVDVEKVKQEYEGKLSQAMQDLNNVKSSLQKRESQITREKDQQIEQLRKQMHEVRMSGMDDTQRKAYESQLINEEYEQTRQKLAEYERKTAEYQQMLDAQEFFLKKGVPADKIILNQGYETLVQSGWDWVTDELTRLRQPQQQQVAPLKTAPSVVTDKSTPSNGTTWAELRTLYGSDENVYRLIEQGQLDPSILPR
jgi:hypothetical protein